MLFLRGQIAGAVLALGAIAAEPCTQGAEAVTDDGETAAGTVVTRLQDAWRPNEEDRKLEVPIRIEARVNYADPMWGNLWLDQSGEPGFLFLGSPPPALRTGQRVLIEGTLVPAEGLRADKVTVTVLRESEPVVPLDATSRFGEIAVFDRRIVTVEGYVDDTLRVDPGHVRVGMIVGDQPAICWLPPDDPARIPDLNGRIVRLTGLYSGRLDPSGTRGMVELWVGRQADVTVVGDLSTDARFDRDATPIHSISGASPGEPVLIRGVLVHRDPGSAMVIRDSDGQIEVRTWQRERIPLGSTVEAIGRSAFDDSRWYLDHGLVRKIDGAVGTDAPPESRGDDLRFVEEIRQLTDDQLAGKNPVVIQGVVTWTSPEKREFYLQDSTGGVKVRFAPGVMEAPRLQKGLRVFGTTGHEHGQPLVDLERVDDIGSMSHPEARLVDMDRAMAGAEDGQWVMMRGFLHQVDALPGWRRLHVITPRGEFAAMLETGRNNIADIGSLVQVQGVCTPEFDDAGQRTGVRLLVPFLQGVGVVDDAPRDPFAIPQSTPAALARMSRAGELRRVHVQGHVVDLVPGDHLVLDHAGVGLRVFSAAGADAAIQVGDTVDAVGVLGREGARTILREAELRRASKGRVPESAYLEDVATVHPELDQRLVRVKAKILGSLRLPDGVANTVQVGNTVFEVRWSREEPGEPAPVLPIGSLVELTGLYWVEFDDSGYPREFDLVLRTASDVSVLAAPAFLTVNKALAGAGILAGVALLSTLWILSLRRRVGAQTRIIRDQAEREGQLQAEIERGQRLQSLGALAGGIAHDFNNLLTVILGNITLARSEPQVNELAGELLDEAEVGTRQACDLTQQLITFAKGGAPILDAVDLVQLVNEVGAACTSGSQVTIEFRPAPDLPPARADRGQLAHALRNLIAYAKSRSGTTGVVSITLDAGLLEASNPGALPAGPYLAMTISDRGAVVPSGRLAGFFDPYAHSLFAEDRFSMAISYSVIKRHGGHVRIESAEATGTVFHLWLPTTERPSRAGQQGALERLGDVAGVTVLVMDDDAQIRRLAGRLLGREGCAVTLVAEGTACLEAYRSAMAEGHPYDVVILDLAIDGGMGGKETMEHLLAIDPRVKGIVSSGYSNDPILANPHDYGFVAVVPKPFAARSLVEAVRRVVSGKTSGPQKE